MRHKRLLSFFALFFVITHNASAQPGIITLFAGKGANSYGGDGNVATSAYLNNPRGLAKDDSGNIYIADQANYRIRKINKAGIISTFAGTGVSGFSGDGGPAILAKIGNLVSVAVDDTGNVYVADGGGLNNRIRKINKSGTITTIAGNGSSTFSGDGGPATAAGFSDLVALTIDHANNIYVSDIGPGYNSRIRKITTTGNISTIAGGGTGGDGGPAIAARLILPTGVAVDKSGNVFIADNQTSTIRKVSATSGIITTVAGGGTGADGGPADSAQITVWYNSVTVDDTGNLYIADFGNHLIHKVNRADSISIIAGTGASGSGGNGGPAIAATLEDPMGIIIDHLGNIYFTDAGSIRKISGDTAVSGGTGASVANIMRKEDVSIYPNPAHDLIQINSLNNIQTITITNAIGQIVYSNSCNTTKAQICIQNLLPGLYFIKLNNTYFQKIIKE